MSEKLQKILAQYGLGSRRKMEQWIEAGRVNVNGEIATLGMRVTQDDNIAVDGKALTKTPTTPKHSLLLYNKPEGEICSRNDPEGRATVFDKLPKPAFGRWIVIGRLDYNTSGLLLFTTDGELAHQLMHPKFHLQRVYAVRIFGKADKEILQKLTTGVELEDGFAKFDSLEFMGGDGANQWYKVSISSGRNRIVRRMWESQGVKINRLMRVKFGDIELPRDLKPGEFTFLNERVQKKEFR